MGARGGKVVESLAENRLRSHLPKAVGVHEKSVVAVEVDVVEVAAAVAKQADHGKQDVAVGDGIGSSGLEIRGERALGKIPEKKSTQMVSARRVEFALAGLEFIVFRFATCWVGFLF